MSSFIKFLILISLTVSVLSGCGGADERKAAYLEKASQSMEKGDYDKARIELKNVLQIDPKDGDAYFQLGKIYELKKEYRKAFGAYSQAAELAPDLLENQAKLGRFYLILVKDKKKAKEKMDFILAKDPQNVDGLLLKASIDVVNRKVDDGIKISEGIFKRVPSDVENATFLASLYLQKKENQKAIQVLDKALEKNKENVQLNQLLARILLVNKKYDRAEVIYKNLLTQHPDSFQNYANLAILYNIEKDKTKAESILQAAIENDPSDVNRQLTLVKYLLKVNGADAAKTELKKLINKYPALGKLRLALADLYVVGHDTDQAKATYKKAIQDFPSDVTGINSRASLAMLYLQEKNHDKAVKELADAIAIAPNNPKINMLIAKIALQDKNFEKAIIALRTVVKETPENIDAYLLLAIAHNANGEKEQAKSVLNNAFENNRSNTKALFILARYYAKLNNLEQTEKMLDAFLAVDSSNYEVLAMKAALLNKQKNFNKAKPVAIKLLKLYPEQPYGYIQSVPYLTKENNRKKAIALLTEGYNKVKDNRLILKILTSLQISSGEKLSALNRVKQAINKSPKDIDLKLLLAKIYLVDKNYAESETLLKNIILLKRDNEEPYILLADMYSKQGNKSARVKIIQQGINATHSLRLALALTKIYETNKNYNDAINLYEKTLIKHPDNLLVMNNLASLLADHRTDKNSLNHAKEIADKLKTSNQPVILDTVGWVYYRSGDYKTAIVTLKKAVKKYPDINIFNYHLGMAYKATGDRENAKLYLKKSLSNNKNFDAKGKAQQALKTL